MLFPRIKIQKNIRAYWASILRIISDSYFQTTFEMLNKCIKKLKLFIITIIAYKF